MPNDLSHPLYHPGELAVQKKAGAADFINGIGSDYITDFMPQQHRQFYQQLPFIVLGLLDPHGRPWTSLAFGHPGFIQIPNAQTLVVNAPVLLSEILDCASRPGEKVGVLGIEPATRRRNRMNGVLASADNKQLSITVDQSYGNCPQYIQVRNLAWQSTLADVTDATSGATQRSSVLSSEAIKLIERADTFFISSRTTELNDDPRTGIDASHRGGHPGFVYVSDAGTITFPDFSGNRFFNTLGNIHADGRVGLLFPDFESGDAVFLTGRADLIWDEHRVKHFRGAERLVDVTIDDAIFADKLLPMRGRTLEPSPVLANTGNWHEAHVNHLKRDGYRQFKVTGRHDESDRVTSFFLQPDDGGPLESYVSGQHLPIKHVSPCADAPLLRTYTLSRAHVQEAYRISVKREQPGGASHALHEELTLGSSIEVASPAGEFTLKAGSAPIVMLSGGIGITPMMAMLDGLVQSNDESTQSRTVWFVHANKNSEVMAFADELHALEQRFDWLNLHVCFSNPLPTDQPGRTHQTEGHLSAPQLSAILPFDAYDFYLCGPEGFMRSLYKGLLSKRVDAAHIHHEIFNNNDFTAQPVRQQAASSSQRQANVIFAKARKAARWTDAHGTLLDFVTTLGLTTPSNCRAGICGTCSVRLLGGDVQYIRSIQAPIPQGHVLLCSSVPAANSSDIIIDV